MIKVDTKELMSLSRRYKEAEKRLPNTIASKLNQAAFQTRGLIMTEIEKSMTIRSPGFVRSKVLYRKTALNKEISNMRSSAGTISKARFSGWLEQETGKTVNRKRSQTNTARRGNFKRKVAPRYRLRSHTKVLSVNNTRTNSGDKFKNQGHFMAYLSNAFRKERSKPLFLITRRYSNLRPGIYTFIRGMRISLIHKFNPADPKPNRYLTRATERYVFSPATKKSWSQVVNNSLKLF